VIAERQGTDGVLVSYHQKTNVEAWLRDHEEGRVIPAFFFNVYFEFIFNFSYLIVFN